MSPERRCFQRARQVVSERVSTVSLPEGVAVPRLGPVATGLGEIFHYALEPDGIFMSNGPGDPEPVTYAVEAAKSFLDRLPVFGICLGHQIMGLACGGKTFKLKFGHRGANHPVKNLETGQVEITSQNHGFCLEPDLFENGDFVQTHVNLNDGTVEGFRHRERPVLSVQYHPEAAPGPRESLELFDRFLARVGERRPSAAKVSC